MKTVTALLEQTDFSKDDLAALLGISAGDATLLFRKAAEVKRAAVGDTVFLRGLIEFSNVCNKDCYYCGLRKSSRNLRRYVMPDEEILAAALFACENNFGSLVLQSGEHTSAEFTARVTRLLRAIKALSAGSLGITLSCGEQPRAVYEEWQAAGAHRYLLRIETASRELYRKIHPDDDNHRFDRRLGCLQDLRDLGYQTGTGVMIGLPFQTRDDLAEDLLFMRDFDVDMVGMGPYVEHPDTPLYAHNAGIPSREDRVTLTLKMTALLRLMMPDINIAAATAIQTLEPLGREQAVHAGANVIMPNMTPPAYRQDYALYEGKPCLDEVSAQGRGALELRLQSLGQAIGYGQRGDSLHYVSRMEKDPGRAGGETSRARRCASNARPARFNNEVKQKE